MRIRNRSLSFPALASAPLSDPSPTPEANDEKEEKEEEEVHMNQYIKQAHRSFYSDHSLPPPKEDRSLYKEDQLPQVNSEIYDPGCKNHINASWCSLPHQGDFASVEEGEEKGSASHKRSKNSGAQTAGFLLSSQAGARWSEGESAFPLKKRKKKYEFLIVSSTEKKRKKEEDGDSISDDDDDESVSVKKVKKNKSKNKKKDNSKSGVLEGSRCSRVNGRGWRCCQATLVGYSLCEHHLGKGRLRSINNNSMGETCSSTSASSKRIGVAKKRKKKQFLWEQAFEDDDDEKEVKTTVKKKKSGVGVVKARSMSSLLG